MIFIDAIIVDVSTLFDICRCHFAIFFRRCHFDADDMRHAAMICRYAGHADDADAMRARCAAAAIIFAIYDARDMMLPYGAA